MTRRVCLLLALAACTARKPAPSNLPVEVKNPGGDVLLAIARAGQGWELRVPGHAAAAVTRTEDGVVIKEGDRTLAELGPGPAGHKLVAGDKTYRVAFLQPRNVVHVLDDVGVTVVAVEQKETEALVRDSTTRQIAWTRKDGERELVTGPAQEPLATVSGLPGAMKDKDLAATLLYVPALPEVARAALFAYVVSR